MLAAPAKSLLPRIQQASASHGNSPTDTNKLRSIQRLIVAMGRTIE
jgi:hypothetical protein